MSSQKLEAVGVRAGDPKPEAHDDGHGRDIVTVTVNDKTVQIHRGSQEVSEIKRLGGVPAADELAQIIEGQPLKPLPDNGRVVLKGGEEFVSHPKDSGSSFTAPTA